MNDRTDRPPRPSGTVNIAAPFLRSILSSERHTPAQQETALAALAQEEEDRSLNTARDSSNPTRVRTIPRPFSDEGFWEPQGGPSAGSLARHRRRDSSRPFARLERQRERVARLARSDPVDQSPGDSSRLSPLSASRTRQPSPHHEPDPQSVALSEGRYRHSKRRKLDDGTSDEFQQIPSYGVEGTLVPGNLKMKVLDTGHLDDSLSQTDETAKLNLYQADNKDVFRCKKHKCNILMKHQGGWPFNLSKIVIKIPKFDVDAVSLQGMVFVSTNGERLLERSSRYDSLVPTSYVLHRPRRYDSYRPSHDYIHSTRPPPQSFSRPRHSSEPHDAQWCDESNPEEPTDLVQVSGFDVSVDRLPDDGEESPTSPRSPPPWHDADHEFTRRQYALRADSYRPSYTADERNRRWRQAPAEVAVAAADPALSETPSDSEDEDTSLYRGITPSQRELDDAEYRRHNLAELMRARRERGNNDGYSYLSGQWADGARYDDNGDSMSSDHEYRRIDSGSTSNPRATVDAASERNSIKRLPGCYEMLHGKCANAELNDTDRELVPHAKFQVTKDGGGVVVNFEPAVSGIYILIKLWTQCPNGGVSVQNIAPYGYAGLRQIPDISYR